MQAKVTEATEKTASRDNHLLAALSAEVKTRLQPHLEWVTLPQGKVLYEGGDTLQYVYFPTDALVSLIYVMENGACAEISVIGNEGLVGIALFTGGEHTPNRAVVQSPGHAWRLACPYAKEEFARHGEWHTLLLRYMQLMMTQMAQMAVCNRHHSIDQQVCRWLLLSLDRHPGNELAITQEQISQMLGVRREGVTEAAGKLRKLGVIEYARGKVTVQNRAQLEKLCCECYAVIRKEKDRLLPRV